MCGIRCYDYRDRDADIYQLNWYIYSSSVDIWNFICSLCAHQSPHSLRIMQFTNWLKDNFAMGNSMAVAPVSTQISEKMNSHTISIAMMSRTSSQMTECAFQGETELSHNFALNGRNTQPEAYVRSRWNTIITRNEQFELLRNEFSALLCISSIEVSEWGMQTKT